MNRRIAAVRGLFEFAVIDRGAGRQPGAGGPPVQRPAAKQRGLLGHIGPRPAPQGGRLVRQPRRLPEALEPDDVAAFLADLRTFRDRAIALADAVGRAARRGGPRRCGWPMWTWGCAGCG